MQISTDFISILLLFGAAQGFFLALILSQKRGNQRANQFLSLLVLLYSVFILDAALDGMNFYKAYPQFYGLARALPFVFGALHFLYIIKLISPEKKLSKLNLLHFIPFFLYRINTLWFDFKSAQYKLEFMQGVHVDDAGFFYQISGPIILFQGLIYMGYSLVVLKRYSDKIKEQYSSIDKINLIWLRNITLLALFVWMVATFEKIFPEVSKNLFLNDEFPVAIVLSFVVYAMGYLGQRQPQIFAQAEFLTAEKPAIYKEKRDPKSGEPTENKYEKSGFSEEKAKKCLQSLLDLMEKEKLFLNSTITLNQLSEKLSVSSHNLSQVINTQLNQSFFDFINKYRVEEVKKTLADPSKSHYTLLSIALDCGFNSKTSFNTVFKKHTNLTPSQYKQVLKVTQISNNYSNT
ncbi:MAG: AraC family transcriptional regulator [Calditrichaeota bacterium]|nr:MAG: AraC family transcriptional regulator [Calditrichota bacterium]MBL1207523.1 AraC family transcriptional regulator [Calditrichota bacterium]NOG47355.1 helix-turn-helix transcriptional regulator [Calditrichota bacterium]